MVGESRTELLKWLNNTLDLSYTKVEQCGNGAAYCQLMDSIYQDVPMARVKMGAKTDYDCSTNMKILQASFQKHGVSRNIDVDRIIKCRLQDNLELLQWLKKYWMERKDLNIEYDAVGRRQGRTAAPTPGSSRQVSSAGGSVRSVSASSRAPSAVGSRINAGPRSISGPVSSSISNGSSGGATATSAKVVQLTKQLAEARTHIEELTAELQHVKEERDPLEIERNFFYNKLISIEELVNITKEAVANNQQTVVLGDRTIGAGSMELIDEVYAILCATQEGFEISNGDDDGVVAADVEMSVEADRFNLEAETF
ncbi:microtubule integrity protein mal3 [Yamadazyma tenuis]|uniref:Uncharacterized protein n=1 Tax=Candida tenuis (strain ATCC 10573 / BCRC 21748 / CBS 615 / JCM 9827 / NBRC 10315 / NRRL Y-1498 / VKM Y-70) TaxID=590646 RepID=G3B4Y5_CANTC|nr:uncharacterized protein CANTEDRAFT_105097 [Yamadazyma tenuis ATCC 10573]EGV64020.1 hypothetical protein CANTEDRAFT_105097 [Yamadazyma tenuis ATCC 10573]WEJ96362.1 microtubule integrity protein mal3 [Yamadazyma tenuis]